MKTSLLKRLTLGGSILVATVLALTLSSSALSGSLPQEPPPPDKVRLSETDDGRQVELCEGQVLEISLESNPSTGYGWEVEGAGLSEAGQGMLRQIGEAEFQPQSQLLGAPGTQILRLEAVRAGDTTLNLVYRRPWEEEEQPAKRFSLQVRGVGPFTGLHESTTTVPEDNVTEGAVAVAPADGDQSLLDLPSQFNWCDLGGCTAVKNQGNCGSCWAFSTVGALESGIRIRESATRDLAEQYLLSCNTDGWSCSGGWFAHDYHWRKLGYCEPEAGAVSEVDFEYVASKVACDPPHAHYEKIEEWHYVGDSWSVPSIDAIKQAIYNYGPVSAAVCVNDPFRYYTGDVFWGPQCDVVNHAIVLVGWDDAQSAWILRNSWGPGWGESGYMRIGYGVSLVGYAANYIVYTPCYHLEMAASPAGGGTISPSPAPDCTGDGYQPESLTDVELTANASPGWHFVAWSGDASGSDNPTTTTMDSHKTVTALFMCDGCNPRTFLPLTMKDYEGGGGGPTTIVSEDFEGSFPGSWAVFDNEAGHGDYYWGKRSCLSYEGGSSGWAVGAGATGGSLNCGSNYPNYSQSWMAYGPFSLVGATGAELQFKLWLNTESQFDGLCRLASTDGTNFYGYCSSGYSSGWVDTTLDLSAVPGLGSLLGQPQAWVALVFDSDDDFNYPEGAYVDNIVVRKYLSAAAPVPHVVPDADGSQITDIPVQMMHPQ